MTIIGAAIPPVEGAVFLAGGFGRIMLVLTIACMVNSFVALPQLARLYVCGRCLQKADFPRMSGGKEAGSN